MHVLFIRSKLKHLIILYESVFTYSFIKTHKVPCNNRLGIGYPMEFITCQMFNKQFYTIQTGILLSFITYQTFFYSQLEEFRFISSIIVW